MKIIRREIPATIEYEDDDLIAIKDIHPAAPLHLLIIPKKFIPTLNETDEDDALLLGKMILTAKRIATEKGVADDGYRLVMNVGSGGGQTVFHLHLHLLAGKNLPTETA